MSRGLSKKELERLAKSKKKAQKANGKEIARSGRKFRGELKQARTRSKYGPSGKPAPVTVKKLDGITGEWEVVQVVDQSKLGAGPKISRRAKRSNRPKQSKGSVARAQRALDTNRDQIERSSRGTPSGKPDGWRMGESPSSSRKKT